MVVTGQQKHALKNGVLVCINTTARKENISSRSEATVSVHQSRQGYEVKQLGVHQDYSQEENIQGSSQSSQQWTYQQVHPKVILYNAQRNCKQNLRATSHTQENT